MNLGPHTKRIGVALFCLSFLAPAQSQERFRVRLATMPIEVATRAEITGFGSGSAVFDGTRLSISGQFAGMQGAATVARLHEGRAMGVRGLAIGELEVTLAPKGEISGEVQLNAAQAESLRNGRLYIQIHSASAPDGNLWGWLLP